MSAYHTTQPQSNNPFRPVQDAATSDLAPPPAYTRYDRSPSPGVNGGAQTEASAGGRASADTASFGSPFAENATWSPAALDHTATSIPSRSFQARIKNRFARTAGDIFNPPAPSFARPLPYLSPAIASQPFEPIIIDGDGSALADSFKPDYPGRILAPRDVSLADFARFLEDIAVAGRLEGKQQLISIAAPLTAHMGLAGHFVTKAIQKRMTRAKEPLCIEAIEHWCQAFFVPRGLDVFAVSMSEGRLTARRPKGEVPDAPRELAMLTKKVERDLESDDDDDAYSSQQVQASSGGFGRRGRGMGRGRGRGASHTSGGGADRRSKRDARRAKRHDKYYLIIAPLGR